MVPGVMRWSRDGKYVYVADFEKTKTQIYKLSVTGRKISEITSYDGVISAPVISPDEKQMAFIGESMDMPDEVYVSELKKFRPKAISSFNSTKKWPAVSKTELLSWKSKDGTLVEGLLTYPSGYKKGEKHPLILMIHGGPAGVYTQTFTGSPSIYVIQFFAGNGYAVLRSNPRGSTGYGNCLLYTSDAADE